MTGKIRIGIIFGGRSGEHEVSLRSAHAILAHLSPEKFEVTQIGIDHNGRWFAGDDVLSAFEAGYTEGLSPALLLPEPGDHTLYIRESTNTSTGIRPLASLDVVFPVLHGTFGEDGCIQGLFELAGIAYVGAGVLGSSLGMDKGVFKQVMLSRNIPTLPFTVIPHTRLRDDREELIAEIEALSKYPLFTKPANLGSSVGISKCYNRSDLIEGMLSAAGYDRRVIVEKGLHKPVEIEVSVLGNEDPIASVPGEIIPGADFYSYNDKYLSEAAQLRIPANLSVDETAAIQAMAREAYLAIDCAGMARVDFLKNRETGEIYLNELNTIPGFTTISMYPKMWEASGISYSELLERLVDLAFSRRAERDGAIYSLRGEK